METKKPRIEVFAFRLAYIDGELTTEQKNTAVLFGVERELARQQLCIQTIRSNLSNLDPIDGSLIISCPKLPKDTDARIGVRKDPKNPDKTQKIFGYNAVLSTSNGMPPKSIRFSQMPPYPQPNRIYKAHVCQRAGPHPAY